MESQTVSTLSNGFPICDGHNGKLSKPIGLYTDPITTTYFVQTITETWATDTNSRLTKIKLETPSYSTNDRAWWIMPDLTKYAPGVKAFEDCTYVITGGSPKALTPTNEIILPASTLPLTQPEASSTSRVRETPESTETRPATSDAVVLPVSTANRQQPTSRSLSEPQSSNDRTEASSQLDQRPPGASPTAEAPHVSSAASKEEEEEEVPSESTKSQDSDAITSSSAKSPNNPISSVGTASDDVSRPNTAGTIPVGLPPDSDGNVAIQEPEDPYASYIALGVSGESLDADNEQDAGAYVLNNGATVTIGQSAVTASGTTLSALSGGVLAVANGESSTIMTRLLASSTPGIHISAIQPSDDAYVLKDGSTITAEGEAITLSGTTYLALASSSGVIAIAEGSTFPLADPTPTPAHHSPSAYVLEQSITISLAGSAATISGTTYSVLPSGSGIVAIASTETTTLAASELFLPASKDTNAFFVHGTATISAGGSAAVISGTTYSVLPSGAGVVVAADGESSTIEPKGSSASNATGGGGVGDGDADAVVPFEGPATRMGVGLGYVVFRAVAVVVLVYFA